MLIDMRDTDFERLYAENAQALFGFLAYRTGDRALAEDVLGEAFEKALRSRRRYDPAKASAKTWLYSIALNCLRDRWRRAEAEARAVERVGGAKRLGGRRSRGLDRVEDRDSLARAMAALSDEEREAVALRYGGELTAPEMAGAAGGEADDGRGPASTAPCASCATS